MTPRQFFAVAVMLSTNYDERLAASARGELESVSLEPRDRAWWERELAGDMERIGAKRMLWLDVHG